MNVCGAWKATAACTGNQLGLFNALGSCRAEVGQGSMLRGEVLTNFAVLLFRLKTPIPTRSKLHAPVGDYVMHSHMSRARRTLQQCNHHQT